jgi:hypothetical protein
VDERRTLNELDPPAWGEPTYDSYLVRQTHKLREKPLGEFTIEDLRIMIGQQIAAKHLVPLALVQLRLDLLCEGDYFPGDLLEVVLRLDATHWHRHPDQLAAISQMSKALSRRTRKSAKPSTASAPSTTLPKALGPRDYSHCVICRRAIALDRSRNLSP